MVPLTEDRYFETEYSAKRTILKTQESLFGFGNSREMQVVHYEKYTEHAWDKTEEDDGSESASVDWQLINHVSHDNLVAFSFKNSNSYLVQTYEVNTLLYIITTTAGAWSLGIYVIRYLISAY